MAGVGAPTRELAGIAAPRLRELVGLARPTVARRLGGPIRGYPDSYGAPGPPLEPSLDGPCLVVDTRIINGPRLGRSPISLAYPPPRRLAARRIDRPDAVLRISDNGS